ncbi:hypothetical protein BAUCODRAFT_27520 [Baudoinia panamericana UAMH 10762]|uniref:GTP-binding protein n=1 Tax=Baudoinia panamericana (strain UAMH 10762) TaxID=717646 RepID=M2LDY6_BAUPA|nr:uncharacterized protein BAUCODRAFT_27520 [Baudoinia panamericana UAMH 10762]EMC92187.1 hypothetical protein BAUCODRAFT_27520 [Baudoinia panamericana UAMH 10762]
MRTLFGENILSPSPTPRPQHNPFELLFHSTASAASSNASTHSSPNQHGWLTQHLQAQQQAERDAADQTTRQPAQHVKRKGHPKLLFMGLRKSGKSSVRKVVFEKLSPADTLFLEPTPRMERATLQSFVPIETAEIPPNAPVTAPEFDHRAAFGNAGAVIWVVDVQDEYLNAIGDLIQTAVFLAENYPRVNFEVFIHKTDGLSEEYNYEAFREVRQRVQDELSDLGHGDRSVSYHQTSIFDYSIFEAMSKVVQRLLPQLPAMEALLNKLCSTCRIQKAYLFDTSSKIYVATDTSPTFLRDYEVCSDYVDVIVDIKQIYGWQKHERQSQDTTSQDDSVGESLVTYDRSGDTYIYAREIDE